MPEDTLRDAIDIRPAERQVWVNGKPGALGARAFDLLMALYERRDRVVGKNELLELVWPGLVVEENNLQVQVSSLRKLLGPHAISTIPGRGYRFTLPDEALARRGAATPSTTGLASETAAAASSADVRPRGNLPASPPMIGRDGDLAEVAALLRSHPVVSIVGAGGIGKTRLALAVAAAADLDLPDGRWWVELAPLARGGPVVSTVASALRVSLPEGRGVAQALASALESHRALLVLDNCEHVATEVAELVAALRAQAPALRILVTSQELLRCADEQAYRLGSLELPPLAADLDAVSRSGAVALFVARARASDPRFRLGADNMASVVEICRRLDGIPLAIELAAARVPVLGASGVRARLDQMFNLLTGADRLALRRHQTLRGALEWSHRLLEDDERAVFRRLGVFAGGFQLALAQQVASDGRIDAWQVLDLLSQLIDKSLVIAEGDDEPRYRLLEPTRAFALERLAEAGESAALLRRHAEAMAGLLADSEAGRWTLPMAQLRRGLAEVDNLRAALDWAAAPGGDRGLAMRLLGTSWNLWREAGLDAEARGRMLALWPPPGGLPAESEAALCLSLASLKRGFAYDHVLAAARRAVALYRELGDREHLADALIRLAYHCTARHVVAEAVAAITEATALIGEAAPPRQRASLQMVLSHIAVTERRFDDARAAIACQAQCYREEGSESGEYIALCNLGWAAFEAGDLDEAVDVLTRGLAGLARLHLRDAEASASRTLALVRVLRGDAIDALAIAQAQFDQARVAGPEELHNPVLVAALHHARQGDGRRAEVLLGFALGRQVLGQRPLCPGDDRVRRQVEALTAAVLGETPREALRAAAARLSIGQAAAIAFDGAPIDTLAS